MKAKVKTTDEGLLIEIPKKLLEALSWNENSSLTIEVAHGWQNRFPSSLVITEK